MSPSPSQSTLARPAAGRRRRSLVGTGLALLVSAAVAAPAGAAPPAAFASQAPVARDRMTSLITALRDRSSANDAQFWRDGVFVSAQPTCIPCHLGPATAAATMRGVDGSAPAWLDEIAIATFDRSLENLGADGTFHDPTNGSVPIVTMFFANELGTALHHLRGRLPAATRVRWTDGLRRAADRVTASGELTWYSNGNIQLGYAEMMYLTWLATGEQRYLDRFETAWAYAMDPPQAATGTKSGKHGLVVTRAGTRADGSDGAGYLTETGVGGLGYDPYYTVLQNDIAARLYLLSRDPRVLRVLNLLTNKQLERVDPATGLLDTRDGTRIRTAGLMPFTTGAVQVLAMTGKRPDLAPQARAQLALYGTEAPKLMVRADHVQYRNVGTEFGTAYQALMEGTDGAAATPYGAAVTRSARRTKATRAKAARTKAARTKARRAQLRRVRAHRAELRRAHARAGLTR